MCSLSQCSLFLDYGCPIAPASLMEKAVFPLSALLPESSWTVCGCVTWFPTVSRWWTHCPSTNTTVSAALIWMPDPPASFCFLFQNHLSYFSSFPFIHIFKLTCLYLHKNLAATLMGIVLDLCINLGRLDITRCAEHFQSWEWSVPPPVCPRFLP